MDCAKHIATGGWWKDSKTHQWVHAAPKLLRYMLDHTEHAKLVGLPVKQPRKPGTSHNSQTSLCTKKASTRLYNSLTPTTRRTEASDHHLGSVTRCETNVPSHCTTTYHCIQSCSRCSGMLRRCCKHWRLCTCLHRRGKLVSLGYPTCVNVQIIGSILAT